MTPIDALKPTLPWGPRVVLSAPTGTGKSTQIPIWMAEEGRVLVIEPRRVACRSLSRYVSQLTRHTVGYAVRFEREGVEAPRILYVTTGVALRLAATGQIKEFSTLIVDEFHERTLEQDLLLALLAPLAPDSHWIVMSATLDIEPLARFLGAQKVHCAAPGYPVAVDYLGGPTVPSRDHLTGRIAAAVGRALAETSGNVLVFLPGMGEIQECRSALRGLRGVETVVLHGSLPTHEQDRAFQSGPRRIVLATNVAETSVTLPGITAVVDSGLVRLKIHRKAFSALSTEAISQASAEQRKGRAGRTETGLCLRLWQKAGQLERGSEPEIGRLDLTDLVMQAAQCGQDIFRLKFLSEPPQFATLAAVEQLQKWGLLSQQRELLATRQLVEFPLPIELARLAPLAPVEVLPDFLDVCALLQTRGSLFDAAASMEAVEQRHADFPGCRLVASVAALRRGSAQRHGLQAETLQQARDISRQLRALMGLPTSSEAQLRAEPLALFLARNWSERVFVRRPKRDAFVNRGDESSWEVKIDRGENLAEETRSAILLEIQPISGKGLQVDLRARHALPCSLAILREAGLGEEELERVTMVARRVVGVTVRRYAALELSREEVELSGPLLREGLCQLLLRGSLWRMEMEQLAERHRLHRLQSLLDDGADPGSWEGFLIARLAELGLENPDELELIGPRDLASCQMETAQREKLAELFPARLARNGVVYAVEYLPEQRHITLRWQSGARNVAFPMAHMPRWPGWRVDLDERGRVTRLR